jgi:hypothetical protein
MSWSSLANNQIVSDSNLADAVRTGVFAAKTAIPESGRELTSTAASDYAYVTTTGYASNQLVPKSSLSTVNVGPGPYNYYVYGVNGYTVKKSTNGGFTFSTLGDLPFQSPTFYTFVAASSSGQYVITGSDIQNNVYYISTDFGATFTSRNIYTPPGVFNAFYPLNADVSSDGQYMVIVGKNQPLDALGQVTVAVSSDYGNSFNLYVGNYSSNTANRASVAISQNGNLIIYVAASTTTIVSNPYSFRFTSTNYGTSFTSGGTSTNQIFTDVCTSNTGQYILIVNKGTASSGNFFVSSNSGTSYTSRSTAAAGEWCGMSANGQYMEVGTYATTYSSVGTGAQWTSFNNGVNWSPGGPVFFAKGMAVGNAGAVPYLTALNYWTIFGSLDEPSVSTPSCVYRPPNAPAADYFFSQPLTDGFTMNKFYRKAIAY